MSEWKWELKGESVYKGEERLVSIDDTENSVFAVGVLMEELNKLEAALTDARQRAEQAEAELQQLKINARSFYAHIAVKASQIEQVVNSYESLIPTLDTNDTAPVQPLDSSADELNATAADTPRNWQVAINGNFDTIKKSLESIREKSHIEYQRRFENGERHPAHGKGELDALNDISNGAFNALGSIRRMERGFDLLDELNASDD